MTTKTATGTRVGWLLPENLGRPSSNAHDTRARKDAFTNPARGIRVLPGFVSNHDEDNTDILLPVEKRQAVLDSFYDN